MRETQSRHAYDLLLQADGAHMPLPDNSIASAFSNSVLEHIPHLDAVLQDVGRVLKSGAPPEALNSGPFGSGEVVSKLVHAHVAND